MPATLTSTGISGTALASVAISLGAMAIMMPRKPSASPSFCLPESRSPTRKGAATAVISGCSAEIRPEIPAGTPCAMLHQTPLR